MKIKEHGVLIRMASLLLFLCVAASGGASAPPCDCLAQPYANGILLHAPDCSLCEYVDTAITVGDVTVSGRMPKGVALIVEAVPRDVAAGYAPSGQEVLFAYDITLMVGSAEYQPSPERPVAVSITSRSKGEGPVEVIHVKPDEQGGTTTEIVEDVTTTEGAVDFNTSGLSTYVITSPKGGSRAAPTELWWSGSYFYIDEACDTLYTDGQTSAFTDLQDVIDAVNGDLTIHMKAAYTVSNTQSVTGGDNAVTLMRYNDTSELDADHTGYLINVSSTGDLTLANITLDGGAIWSGATHEVVGRGITNGGVEARNTLILVSGNENNKGTLLLNGGAILQNNHNIDESYTGGGLYINGGTVTINGAQIKRCEAQAGGAIRINGGSSSLTIEGGTFTSNWGRYAGGVISYPGGTVVINDGSFTNNFTNATSLGGGVVSTTAVLTVTGGTFRNNRSASDHADGINMYESVANLHLSGSPAIYDDVYFAISNNKFVIDSAFTPSPAVPFMLGNMAQQRTVATYNEGLTPNVNHFSIPIAGASLSVSGQDILYNPPVNTSVFVIYTTKQVGSRLTAHLGSGATTSSYQWQSSVNGTDYTPISGATGKTYTATPNDIGRYIRVGIDGGHVSDAVQIGQPTFTIAIPEAVPLTPGGGNFGITASNISSLGTVSVDVSVASANGFKLVNSDDDMDYGLFRDANQESAVSAASPNIASFTQNGAVTLYYTFTPGDPVYAGTYADTLTFTVTLTDD